MFQGPTESVCKFESRKVSIKVVMSRCLPFLSVYQGSCLRTWHNHRSVRSVFPVPRHKEQRFKVAFCFSTISSCCIFPLFELLSNGQLDCKTHCTTEANISETEMIDLLFTARDFAWNHQLYYCTAVVARVGKIQQRIVQTTVCLTPSISAAFIELTGL